MQDNDWGSTAEKKVVEAARRFGSRKPPRKALLMIALVLLVVWGVSSSYFKVNPEETGVVLRFGKFSRFAQPGPNLKIPFGVDDVYMVPTGRNFKEEFGFRTVSASIRTVYSQENLDEESLTLTGDLNVSDVEWIVQYQIADPFKFIFRIKDPEITIRDLSEAVVRKVVGNSNVTEVLTTDRALLASRIQKDLQTTLNDYEIGVRIVTVKFQDVNPPDPVKAAFNEVNEAEQQKESLIFQAREQYNREVPKARGVAKSRILEAEGYAVERINRARGEAKRFSALLAEFRKAPEVTRRRLYIETMENILPKVSEIYVMDKTGTSALPLLPLRQFGKEVK